MAVVGAGTECHAVRHVLEASGSRGFTRRERSTIIRPDIGASDLATHDGDVVRPS